MSLCCQKTDLQVYPERCACVVSLLISGVGSMWWDWECPLQGREWAVASRIRVHRKLNSRQKIAEPSPWLAALPLTFLVSCSMYAWYLLVVDEIRQLLYWRDAYSHSASPVSSKIAREVVIIYHCLGTPGILTRTLRVQTGTGEHSVTKGAECPIRKEYVKLYLKYGFGSLFTV